MAKIIIVVLSILFFGCCHTKPPEPKIEYKEVYIEVPIVAKKPPKYAPVILPIYSLTEADKKNKDKIAEAYFNSIVILQGEVKKRDLDLDVYRNFKIEEK